MLPKLGENSPRIQDTKYDSLQLTMNSTKGSGNRKQHTYVSRDISKRNMQGSSFRSMLQGSARTRKPSIPSTNRSPKKTQFNLAKSERPNTDKLYDSKYMAGTINSRHNKTEALKSQMHIMYIYVYIYIYIYIYICIIHLCIVKTLMTICISSTIRESPFL